MNARPRKWMLIFLLIPLLTGCLPYAARPDQVPQESKDPARNEDSAADEAERRGDGATATAHRERAAQLRRDLFASDCNVVAFLIGLLVENKTCAGPVSIETPKHYL